MLVGDSLAVRMVAYNHQRDTIALAQLPAQCGLILLVQGEEPANYYSQSMFCSGVPLSPSYSGFVLPPGDSIVVVGHWSGRTFPPQPRDPSDTRVAPAGRYSLRGRYVIGIHEAYDGPRVFVELRAP